MCVKIFEGLPARCFSRRLMRLKAFFTTFWSVRDRVSMDCPQVISYISKKVISPLNLFRNWSFWGKYVNNKCKLQRKSISFCKSIFQCLFPNLSYVDADSNHNHGRKRRRQGHKTSCSTKINVTRALEKARKLTVSSLTFLDASSGKRRHIPPSSWLQ
jgi:hypothetical protein